MQSVFSRIMGSVSLMLVLVLRSHVTLKTVLSHPPYMDTLPDAHWRSLVWMMKCAERSFRMIADHSVLSHLHHAKQLVPFKTFTSSRADFPENFNAQFLVELPLGQMFFYDATQMLTSRSALFRCFSRGNLNISMMIRLLYIFASYNWCCHSITPGRLLVV
jgi:hypothetical protein